jgi:hypothetical protein
VEERLTSALSAVNDKLKSFKKDVFTTMEQIAGHLRSEALTTSEFQMRLNRLEQTQGTFLDRVSNNVSADDVPEYTEAQLDILCKVMIRMDRQIHDLIDENQQDAVKFNGFGFQ